MKITRGTPYVSVQAQELHYVDAVITMPAQTATTLIAAGFIRELASGTLVWDPKRVSNLQHPCDDDSDLLYKIPGAFIERSPIKRNRFGEIVQ